MPKQKFRESREKLAKFCVVEIPNSVHFFQKEIYIPRKIENRPKFLDLVSRNVGLNPDIQISDGLFNTAKYEHSQNRQNLSTHVNNKTISQQETSEQLSL